MQTGGVPGAPSSGVSPRLPVMPLVVRAAARSHGEGTAAGSRAFTLQTWPGRDFLRRRGSCEYAIHMQEVGISSLEEVILNWLRSEWSRLVYGTPSDRSIIDNANLGDAAENARRRWLLRHRANILDEFLQARLLIGFLSKMRTCRACIFFRPPTGTWIRPHLSGDRHS